MAGSLRVGISLTGAKRTQAVLTIKETAVKRAVRHGVVEWANIAVRIMRSIVPVRSGKLRDAIQVDSVDRTATGGWSAFVGPGDRVRYPAFVEYGTHRTPEQPYARPTNRIASSVGPVEIAKAVRRVT